MRQWPNSGTLGRFAWNPPIVPILSFVNAMIICSAVQLYNHCPCHSNWPNCVRPAKLCSLPPWLTFSKYSCNPRHQISIFVALLPPIFVICIRMRWRPISVTLGRFAWNGPCFSNCPHSVSMDEVFSVWTTSPDVLLLTGQYKASPTRQNRGGILRGPLLLQTRESAWFSP